jgi:hypothetical protein
MDQQPSKPIETAPDEFPTGPCKRGSVYGMDTAYANPDGSPQKIIILSLDSWTDFGTTLESLRQVAAKQDARIKELLADIAVRDLKVQQAQEAVEIHREIRRKEKRAEIGGEMGLVLPGSHLFNAKGK